MKVKTHLKAGQINIQTNSSEVRVTQSNSLTLG
jgi:hypothetical protein